ncbi:breast cancer associated RING 1 [Actinidia rufa]|uniref:Breast cancer associated RING 1 n=1 Tax=Actinidia rufa TaxID=165716 RepID=A0A7J0FLF6_9ERIC|nr:breast cancer associated RING 1 [Actinidia rufa]
MLKSRRYKSGHPRICNNCQSSKATMADASNHARFLNPWVLHHQKLGLELKCPLCFCVPRLSQFGSECPVCARRYEDLDEERAPSQSPVLLNTNVDNRLKESVETPQEGNSSNGECTFSLTTSNKRVRAPLNYSIEEGKSDKSTPNVIGKAEEIKVCDGGKTKPPQYPGWARGAKPEDQVLQLSPVSPPSFDTKGLDGDSSDPGSRNNSSGKDPAKRLHENNSCKTGDDVKESTSPGAEVDHARDAKRPKKSMCNTGEPSNGCTQANVFHSKSIATSKLEPRVGELSGKKAPTTPDSCDASDSICAFCQSFALTDRTGPMLHYVNGKEVVGDAATNSNVIHAHKICIEWTPQAYFVGETVKNLKAEVARAAKLKCSSCGLKGAALGCLVKSCRKSYHVPCAIEIVGCRWDFEDFLMLCPSHSSVKFPCEKFKSRKHTSEKQHFMPNAITSKQTNVWRASANGEREWVFCGAALSTEEKYLLSKFASICGATVSKFWKPNVTHVIAATDAKGACSRTLKVLKAILKGRWVLKTEWIKACMEAMQPVDEEPYEVGLDNHGCHDGPKTGRLRALDNESKLFNDLNFYFSGDFVPGYKEDLLDLVITAGGTVIKSKEQLVAQSRDSRTTHSATLVVYNNDPAMQGGRLEEEGSVVLQRIEAAENLAIGIGSPVIAHTWLLESIAACKLQPFPC